MKQYIVLFASSLLIWSCQKQTADNVAAGGCVERIVIPVSGHSINAADISLVNKLFLNNHIDNSKFRYYQYIHQVLSTPSSNVDDKIVKVDEYTNDLRIFAGQLTFDFKEDVFNFKGGYPTNGTLLNTSANLALPKLRGLFTGNIEQFDGRGAYYRDSCFKAEFGYFNLNAGTGDPAEKLVKAWRITLKNSVYPSEYPQAYYQDENAGLIYYDNGIRIYK